MGKEQDRKKAPHVLIVDDVDTNRFVLRDIIQEMGYQPILTENGVQALKIVERIRPQLVILDVAMPEMDGYEFCHIMKESPETKEIPIIFISAFDEPSDVVRGFTLGGEDYVTKPFIPEVVKARVGVHMKLYEASYELQEANRLLKTVVNTKGRQVEMGRKRILDALVHVVKKHPCYDEAHMERLISDCHILAVAMQLSTEFGRVISDSYIRVLEAAVPLHDLGYVALPTSLLEKKELLTEEEQRKLRSHTEAGAQILSEILEDSGHNDLLQMSADIAHYHHENWDGSGYPCGMKGDEIPLAARIVAVADACCTMLEDPDPGDAQYREHVLEQIKRGAGTKYDPAIFQILCKIFRQFR